MIIHIKLIVYYAFNTKFIINIKYFPNKIYTAININIKFIIDWFFMKSRGNWFKFLMKLRRI